MPGVDRIDETLAIFDESSSSSKTPAKFLPVRGVEVFAYINSLLVNMWKEHSEGRDLLIHLVTPIVDQNVNSGESLCQMPQEFFIGLVPDENRNLFFLQLLAIGIDIDSIDPGLGTKVAFPHLQGPAVEHPDFQQMNFRSPEP